MLDRDDIELGDFKASPPVLKEPIQINLPPPKIDLELIKIDPKLDLKPSLTTIPFLPKLVDQFEIKHILSSQGASVIKAKEVTSEIKDGPLALPKEVIQDLVDEKNPNTVADDIKHHLRLEAGPQNKSEDTKQLEQVVISVLNDPKAIFSYDRNLKEVFVELKEQAPINLSLLIKKANLSHVRFTDEQINQYLDQMNLYQETSGLLHHNFDFKLLPEPFCSMPTGLLAALRLYTTTYSYNEFAYGIFKDGSRTEPADLKSHLLTVCMAGHAISILPTIYSEKVAALLNHIKEKAELSAEEYVVFKNDLHHGLKDILAKMSTTLDSFKVKIGLTDDEFQDFKNYLNPESKYAGSSPERIIILSLIAKEAPLSEEERLIFKIYLENKPNWQEFVNQIKSKVDAILTVAEKEFLQIFKIPKCISRNEFDPSWLQYSAPTLLRRVGFLSTSLNKYQIRFCDKLTWMPPIIFLSAMPREAELLLPPGEQFLQFNDVIKLVNTPVSHRMSSNVGLAIRYAFLHHFVKPYKGDTDTYVHGQFPVPRSNHGLAHTMRKVFYLDSILNYLAQHALHISVRETVSALIKNPDIVNYLKLALVFSVTGRESEISFKQDPETYLADRAQSVKNFEAYARQTKMDIAIMQFIVGLIRNINDPALLQKDHIKHHDSLLTHILSFAHNLDLMRCVDKRRYLEGIETYGSFPFVETSDKQQQAFDQLLAYATAAIKITGDNLWCQYVTNQGMSEGGQSQSENFVHCSWSPRKCEELLEQIPTPELCLPGFNPDLDAIACTTISKIAKQPDSEAKIAFPAFSSPISFIQNFSSSKTSKKIFPLQDEPIGQINIFLQPKKSLPLSFFNQKSSPSIYHPTKPYEIS